MTLIGKYWGPIAGMASGKVSPYNADVVSRNATYLENLAQMPWDGFHESTKDEKSRALPEIWSQKAKFDELAQRLQSETAKLGQIARAKDEAGVKQQYAAVGKVCGACHEDFRAEAVHAHVLRKSPALAGLFFLCVQPRGVPASRKAMRSAANISPKRAAASAATP